MSEAQGHTKGPWEVSDAEISTEFSTLGEIVIQGRPDFSDWEFGVTYAKTFPQYVYSLGHNGQLIHKVAYVSLRWWEGCYDKMVRRRNPLIIAETVCGCSRFIQSGGRLRAAFCEIPKPDAVLCKRCLGEAMSTFPRKDPKSKQRQQMAKIKLGCLTRARGL